MKNTGSYNNRKQIYYIEDDRVIADEAAAYLNGKGYDVTIISGSGEAQRMLNRQIPALCLVDWNLPDGSGGELCRWIRGRWPELPVIFLTVRDRTDDIVNGFHIGADDYITKPFELEILYSRISALLRRVRATGSILACGPVTVDTDTCQVMLNGDVIHVSFMEYQVLMVLIENKNRTVTRKSLLEQIWDSNGNYVNDNTLTVTMKRLREKLLNPACIKTVRSFGYRMEEPDEQI